MLLKNSPKQGVGPRNFLGFSVKVLSGKSEEFCGPENSEQISQEFLENESQNCDPPKISRLMDEFWRISQEFPRLISYKK